MSIENLVKLIETLTPEQTEAAEKYIASLSTPLKKTLTPWELGRFCGNTAKYHSKKYKHWCKRVTSIDITKSNGYAFEGDFLPWGKQTMAGVGDCFLEHCDGSYLFWMVTDDEHCEQVVGSRNDFCDFILKSKKMMDDKTQGKEQNNSEIRNS